MRLLLNTHVFLWSVTDSKKLKRVTRDRIVAADEVYVLAASIWEIAIKLGAGKMGWAILFLGRQGLHKAIQILLPFVEGFDENPFVLAMSANIVDVAKQPGGPVGLDTGVAQET